MTAYYESIKYGSKKSFYIGITSSFHVFLVHAFMVPNIFLSVGEGSIKKGKEL